MSELKPCPFCGGCKIVNEEELNVTLCYDCSAETDISDWNNRPIEDELNRRIAELEAERRWIPVSERLPEATEYVYAVVYDAIDNTSKVSMLKHYGDGNWFSWESERYVVTHWMPLPKLPEVQG